MTRRPDAIRDPVANVNRLGAVWSPDFGADASGQLDASRVRGVLCRHAPCAFPPFGTAAYLALVEVRQGCNRGGA